MKIIALLKLFLDLGPVAFSLAGVLGLEYGLFGSRAWRFYQKGELVELVDISLGENFNIDEACRYIKIALLCTHFMPNSRPSMSSVVKMLTGEEDVDDTKISEPGLLTELVGFRNRKKKNLQILSAAGSGNEDKSPWNTSICTTQATMTFTSISDRST
nr:putative serine/threonine-protein kinase [Ipomoea batatas]